MKRISIIALLSVLFISESNATYYSLGPTLDLARALSISAQGDTILLSAGVNYAVGDLLPTDIAINIDGGAPTASVPYGILNFTDAVSGLIFNAGVFVSNVSDVHLAGQVLNAGRTITNQQSTLNLTNVALTSGGGILNNEDSVLHIMGTDAVFNSNTATQGGAIYNNGTVQINDNAIFVANKTTPVNTSSGGAIYNYGGTLLIGNNNQFGITAGTGNVAQNGGGAIHSSNGNISMGNGNSFSYNQTNYGDGGAISYTGDGNITIGNSNIFNYNSATKSGGAIVNVNGIFSMGSGSEFIGNTAGNSGGAIYNRGTMTIGGALFSNNTAEAYGGAIYNDEILTFTGVVNFDRNNAIIDGGAIYNVDRLTISSGSSFTNNTAVRYGGAINNYLNDATLSLGGNIVFSGNNSATGAAFYNQDGTVKMTGGAIGGLTFINNTATSNGGAIFGNVGTIDLGDVNGNILFSGNTAASGGAIFNQHGALTIGATGAYTTTFENNTATTGSGGAISYSRSMGTDEASLLGKLIFNKNTSVANGGAISASTGVLNIADGAIFTNNTAKSNGGAIYNSGAITSMKDFVFTGNTAGQNGGAIYNTRTLSIGGATEFKNNIATGGNGGGIYNYSNATLDVSGVKFDGNTSSVAGGAISNAGKVTINGGTTFTNNKTTYYGGAIYNDSVLTLDTTTGGNIDFSNNTASMGGDIYNDITLNIMGVAGTNINLNSATGIYNDGKATINKSGANILNIAGTATGTGTFIQTDGITVAKNGFFTGGISKTNISNSSLTVSHTAYDYGVTLGTGGYLIHTNKNETLNNISSANLAFETGANNLGAIFNTSSGVIGNYNLATKIDNGGTDNFLSFDNSNITFGSNDYTGTTNYIFTNDNVNLSTPDMQLRTLTFDYMTAINTKLSFDLYADVVNGVETFTSDKVVINHPDESSPAIFELGAIRMLENADNGLAPFAIDNVLNGATFVAGGKVNIATTAYEYQGVVNAALTGLNFDVIGPSDRNSLNNMNIDINDVGTRGFNFSFFQGPQTYNIAANLGVMAAGDFTVWGYDTDAKNAVIDGNTINSMFDVQNKTVFTVSDLTIQNVLKTGDDTAGAIRVQNADAVVAVNNVIFQDNRTTDSITPIDENTGGYGGAAVYMDAGNTIIQNSLFTNNNSERGGAIYIQGPAKTQIINTEFVGNYARAKHGGAIEVLDADSIAFDTVRFDDNHAQMWGGAISFNEGPDSFGSDNFSDGINFYGNNEFTNNTAAYGGAINVNMVNSAPIVFHGDVLFENNTAQDTAGLMDGIGIGGAISSSQNRGGGNLTFNGNAIFRGNNALADNPENSVGGAMYIVSMDSAVNITFNGNALFENNHSDGTAGAIGFGDAIEDFSQLTFNINDGNFVMFDGNTAGDVANDIHFAGDTSEMNINGAGGMMTLNGGIASDGDTDIINMNNDGVLEFGANSVNNNFGGTFNQKAGTTNVYANNWIAGDNVITGGTLHFLESVETGGIELATGGELDVRAFQPTMLRRMSSDGNQYNTITMTNFTGSGGDILMNTNGSQDGTDMLKITESATGNATLNFAVVPNSTPVDKKIEVVDYVSSDATFKLVNDTLDIGAWEYKLVNEVDDGWYLETEGDLNATAQSIAGIPALHLSVVKTGMNELRKRLGALRDNNNDEEAVGGWVRGYGKHLRIHEDVDAKMNLFGVEGGFDIVKNALNGKIYFGIMGGMLDSEDVRFNTSVGGAGGWTRTPSVGAYATWVHKSDSNNKWFVDLTARHFWAHTYVEKDDKTNGYDVKRNFWAFSAETGKLFYAKSADWMNVGTKQHSRVSVEPKLELRYKRGASEQFETFAGNIGYVDTTESFSAHLNLQMNFLPNGTQSVWKPYIELGVYNEFMGETEMEFADTKLCTSDTSGMGMVATIGTNANISDKTYAYGAYTFETGEVYTSHQLNIGIRTKF